MSRLYSFVLLLAAALAGLTGCDKFGAAVKPPESSAEQSDNAPRVKVETSVGDFIITLQPDKAPNTVAQFIENVNNGIYDNSIVHNVIQNYEILIGGVKPTTGNPESYDIPNEATSDNSNKQWTVAMLHAPDKTVSDSVQFFINLKDNLELDAQQGGELSPETCGYCVFGIVTDGFNALQTINQTPTTVKGEFEFAPEQDVAITKMTVL